MSKYSRCARALITLSASLIFPNWSIAIPPPACFRIYDATGYAGKPDMASFGIEPAYVYEADRFWPDGGTGDDLPKPSAAQHWMHDIAGKKGRLILDIERWSLWGGESQVRESMRRYATILDWFREAGYSQPIGYYNVLPIWDRNRATQDERSAAHRRWQADDDLLMPLVQRVDVLFPSLYTPDRDIDGWTKFARAHIKEARRLAKGKPIYVFLWPQFHQSNKDLGLKYIPGDIWTQELETASTYADGAVIWGGSWDSARNRAPPWDESAEWWIATKRFLGQHPTCNTRAKTP